MTSNITKRIIDADGHIAEDAQAIIAHISRSIRFRRSITCTRDISSTCRRARSIARSDRRNGWPF